MCQFAQSQVAAGNLGDRTKKQLEEIEENNENRQEKELAKRKFSFWGNNEINVFHSLFIVESKRFFNLW